MATATGGENPPGSTQLPAAAPKGRVFQIAIHSNTSDTTLHLHLSLYSHAIVLFVAMDESVALQAAIEQGATETAKDAQNEAPQRMRNTSLASFVVATPDFAHPDRPNPVATPLYQEARTLDLCSRLARMLSAQLQKRGEAKQVYVGICGGIRSWSAEEEAEVVRNILHEVVQKV